MEIDNKYLSKHKLDYLLLSLKIHKMRYHGSEPPKELVRKAYEAGRLAGVSEEELKTLWAIRYVGLLPYSIVNRDGHTCSVGFMGFI